MPKKWGIALIVSGILVVLATTWYLRQPMRLAEKALAKAGDATSHAFHGTVVLENSEQTTKTLGEEGHIELMFDGAYTKPDQQAANIQTHINASIASESLTVQLTGEARFINDKTYIFIEKAPAVFPVLQKLRGQWIELDRGQASSPAATLPTTEEALLKSIQFTKRDKIGEETVNQYHAVATQTAIVRFMNTIAQLLGTNLTNEQIDQLRGSTNQVTEVPVELWITPYGATLRQLKTKLAVPGRNTIDLTLELNHPNEPVEITPPEGAIALPEVVKKLQPAR